MVTCNRIRNKYTQHFIWLLNARAAEPSGGGDPPFYVLHFTKSDGENRIYATFGASLGALEHELVIWSAGPLPVIDATIEAVARAAPAGLSPLGVVPWPIADTPFEALFVLPADDGTFALGKSAGKTRYAYRLVPITRAERGVAEKDPLRLLALLRDAYALVADPYRACVVACLTGTPAERDSVAWIRKREQDLIAKVGNKIRAKAEKKPYFVPYDDVARLCPCNHKSLTTTIEGILADALFPYANMLPPRVTFFFAELLYMFVTTHPEAVRMLNQTLDPSPYDARRFDHPDEATMAAALRKVTADVVLAFGRFRPQADAAALLARATRAADEAPETFEPKDVVSMEGHVWAEVLLEVYEGVHDNTKIGRGMAHAVHVVTDQAAVLELDPDPRPPLVRLRHIAARLATSLFLAYMGSVNPEAMLFP